MNHSNGSFCAKEQLGDSGMFMEGVPHHRNTREAITQNYNISFPPANKLAEMLSMKKEERMFHCAK